MPEPNHFGIAKLLDRFENARVVVLGDIMLDEYWWGAVDRISPEAPVPVVSVRRRESKLGGAANVARNIRSLGGAVTAIGVIGSDEAGEAVRRGLAESGLADSGLVVDPSRPTTVKTRIVAHNQQIVRADFEEIEDVGGSVADRLATACCAALDESEGMVISDYGKGVITGSLLGHVTDHARRNGKFVAVDPKDSHFSVYRRVTTLTPNHHEAGFMAGRRIRDTESLRQVGFELLRRLEADSLLITRGEEGMALFEPDGRLTLIPTVAKMVYDVTGAGDTVVAAVAITLAAGGTMRQAAYAANVAAGEVIREVGTAFTTVDAIRQALGTLSQPAVEDYTVGEGS